MMNELLAGRYQLLKPFKLGGSSILFKAIDSTSEQSVILKFSDRTTPDAIEALRREAQAFQQLGHVPGLVRFLDYEENQGHRLGPFLALEFLTGISLNEYLMERRPFSEQQAITLGRNLCKILGKLHARGVVYRNISPSNIFLLEDSKEIRLVDLGLALIPCHSGGYEPHEVGAVGIPATRAPELSDSFSGDVRSDIYSLGKVLGRVTKGVENSVALSEVIVRCVKTSPEERYQSMKALDWALATIPVKKAAKPLSVACGVAALVLIIYAIASRTETAPKEPQTMQAEMCLPSVSRER